MSPATPRILMFSPRHVANTVLARCLWFEFEDIINQIDAVEMLAPIRAAKDTDRFDRKYRLACRVGRILPFALNPGVIETAAQRKYDLFFALCLIPSDLLYINTVRDWRQNCRVAVCWFDEILLTDFRKYRYLIPLLKKFDHIIVSCNQALHIIQRHIKGKCLFVPPGVDALAFCPFPNPSERFIDVLSIGRRPAKLHAQLLNLSAKNEIVYFYDTISSRGAKYGLTTDDPPAHRLLLCNLLKKSRCFVACPGKFDDPAEIGKEEIIGARYFEGAAAGTLLIGRAPRNPLFTQLFPSPNAVCELPPDATDIADRILGFIKHSINDAAVQKSNLVRSLLHHDWVYRWQTVLTLAGLEDLPAVIERKRRLEDLSALVQKT
jgi:hypothetical protein